MITIFNGSVKLPDDYFTKNKVVVLPLKFGMGHPVAGHPVSDLLDPADPTKVKTPNELPDLPPATLFGSARFTGEGSGQQHGILLDVPQGFESAIACSRSD